jgi:hypothetical protein
MLGVVDAAHFSFVELVPGTRARFHRVSADRSRVVCTGEILPADALALTAEAPVVEAVVDGETITVWLDQVPVLTCELDLEALTRGLVGVGVIGDTGSAIRLDSLAVAR